MSISTRVFNIAHTYAHTASVFFRNPIEAGTNGLVPYNTIQYNALKYTAVHFNSLQCYTILKGRMQHIRYTYHQLDTLSILEHCGQTKPLRRYGGAFQAGRDCFGISSCSTYALMPEGPEGPEGAEGDDLTWPRLESVKVTSEQPIRDLSAATCVGPLSLDSGYSIKTRKKLCFFTIRITCSRVAMS